MPLRLALATALLAASLAAPLVRPAMATQEFRFEGMAFEPPGGWEAVPDTRPGIWQIRRTFEGGRGGGTALIQVARPIPASEGPFDAVFARLAGSLPGLENERPTTKGEGETADGHRIRYDTRCCARRNDRSIGTETVGISDGRRHAILLLVSIGLRGEASRRARAEFDALVRSFRLDAAAPPAALRPPPGAGGLEGTFTHLRTGIVPNAFGGTDFRAENEVRVFDPGGLFSRAVPAGEGGVAAHCRAAPSDCGTYRLAGPGGGQGGDKGPGRIELRTMTARYGLIEVEAVPFARDGDRLVIDGETHRRVPPLPRGTVFEGRWRFFQASSGSTAFSSGGASSERILTMTRDGRFRRTGSSGVVSSNEAGGTRTGIAAGRERPAESGRYEVEGYRLTLVGDDGRWQALSLVLPEPGEDRLLVIDGDNYLRRDAP